MTPAIADSRHLTAAPAPRNPYASGAYFANQDRHGDDAMFKAQQLLKLLPRALALPDEHLRSYVDVGTGSGDAVHLVAKGLRERGVTLDKVKGYDVSPHVLQLQREGVQFVHGDFTRSSENVDLVTLFDVFEHVPDPISFLRDVAARCRFVGLHIPLDASLNVAMRDLFRSKLKNPGHLLFMDTAFALNLLALSGLRVLDYSYTFSFEAPSGKRSALARGLYPLRRALARLSPWMLSKTLGGASLIVLASTPSASTAPKI